MTSPAPCESARRASCATLFHQAIHRAAHSPRVLAQIKQAARVVPTNFLTVFPEHEKHSLSEHEELLVALGNRDAEGARSIAERHVLAAGRSLADWLDQRAENSPSA